MYTVFDFTQQLPGSVQSGAIRSCLLLPVLLHPCLIVYCLVASKQQSQHSSGVNHGAADYQGYYSTAGC